MTWYGFVATVIAYFVTGPVRYLIYFVCMHIGFDFWILPNFYLGFYKLSPIQVVWPLMTLRLRDDFFSPMSLTLRILSASFMIYFAHQFYQDE